MVTDDLDAAGRIRRAMPVMKMKPIRFQRVNHFDVAAQLPIVISRHDCDCTTFGKSAQQLDGFARRCFVVNQITEDDNAAWFVLVDEFGEPLRDRRHSPQRNESAGRALAQFITKMQVRDREPTLRSMEKREPSIEKNFIGDERLVRA